MEKRPELSKAVNTAIELSKRPEAAIVFDAGVALQYAFVPPNIKFSAHYVAMGKELWAAADYELHSHLCDAAKRAPKDWLQDIVSGDVRELTVAILTILVASLHVPLSIAVPLAALIIKRKLAAFCRRKPRKPRRTLVEIIEDKKRHPEKDVKGCIVFE